MKTVNSYMNKNIRKLLNKISFIYYTTFVLVNNKDHYLLGQSHGDLVKTYWFSARKNFGDLLTPELLRNYGLRPFYSSLESADVVCVGSLLDNLPEEFPGFIVGTGLIQDITRNFPRAKIMAVRGELTRERINAPKSTILGDPGLLADRLLNKRQIKQFLLGIVPHYHDKMDAKIHTLFHKNRSDIVIIDVQANPLTVLSNIDKCCHILSSSLHGIVTADSLGIPNAWIKLSGKVFGDGFKFFDYESAFGLKYEPIYLTGSEKISELQNLTHEVPDGVQKIKDDLDSVFIKLRNELLAVNQESDFKAG